jgi:hypothetical protein
MMVERQSIDFMARSSPASPNAILFGQLAKVSGAAKVSPAPCAFTPIARVRG